MEIKRDLEIEQQIEKAYETEKDSKFADLTYEQGIIAALNWVYYGETEPMEGEIQGE